MLRRVSLVLLLLLLFESVCGTSGNSWGWDRDRLNGRRRFGCTKG
jgi:hypothetical protein